MSFESYFSNRGEVKNSRAIDRDGVQKIRKKCLSSHIESGGFITQSNTAHRSKR